MFMNCKSGRNDMVDTCRTLDHLSSTYSDDMNNGTDLNQNNINSISTNCTRSITLSNSKELFNELETSCSENSSCNNSTETNRNSLHHITSSCSRKNSINNSSDTNGNSLNCIKTTKNNTHNLRNSPAVSLKKPSPALLPPCRICGAKASGLHYGVNSCEACKGFFRRTLKRPLAFYCTKNRKCNVNGNRRSTCRFCRYKLCLMLGMSKESIKTGRYSHNKRTRDTIEVKRLQNSPNALMDELEMDVIIKTLISADCSLIVSTTNVPTDVIYRKQLEFHNAFLHKKCGNYTEFSKNNFTEISTILDHDSKHSNSKDVSPYFSEFIKLSTTSLSSSEFSPDSGFVDESDFTTDGNKSELTGHEICDNNEYLPESINIFGDQPTETTSDRSNGIYIEQHDTPAVKNHQQEYINVSEIDKILPMETFVRDSNHECSNNWEMLHCKDIDFLTQQHPGSIEHYSSNEYSVENKSKKQNNGKTSKQMSNNIPSSDEIIEIYTNSINNFSINISKDVPSSELRNISRKDYHNVVNDESCVQHTDNTSLDAFASKPEITYRRHVDQIAQNTTSHLQTQNSHQSSSRNNCISENLYGNPNGGTTQDSDDPVSTKSLVRSKGHMSEVDCMSTFKPETELWKRVSMGEFKDSLGMRRESQEVIIKRVKKLIRGYIDFAKMIPGFASLGAQDQAALLKHAWDEAWILGTCRGYNSSLGVVMAPSGRCFHGDEMERVWGKSYSQVAFNMAKIINRQNLTPGLISLLKAVCIVTPDRCQLSNPTRVADIHWMVISCLLRHIQMTCPGDHMVFPRLISILTSLRELSESARGDLDNGSVEHGFHCSGLDWLVTFF